MQPEKLTFLDKFDKPTLENKQVDYSKLTYEELMELAKEGDVQATEKILINHLIYMSTEDLDKIPEETISEAIGNVKSAELADDITTNLRLFHDKDEYAKYSPKKVELTDEYIKLSEKTWYRGLTKIDDFDLTKGRDNCNVYLTDDPIQAATYAGKDGYIVEMKLKGAAIVDKYEELNERFSPVAFDYEVSRTSLNSIVVANNVHDRDSHNFQDLPSPKWMEKNYKPSTNIGLNRNNELLDVVKIHKTNELIQSLASENTAKNKRKMRL